MDIMREKPGKSSADSSRELVIFQAGDLVCGLDSYLVQEINGEMEIRTAPRAPAYVRGVINLRGEIVTVIDLRVKLGFDRTGTEQANSVVIVRSGNESIGLSVDMVSDVVVADPAEIEPPPANISGVDSVFFQGIFKMKEELVVILNAEEIFRVAD